MTGWRIDVPGARHVTDRGETDAGALRSALSGVSLALEGAVPTVDDVVGAALRRYQDRWAEASGSLDRRSAQVVDGARTVLREHLWADERMATTHEDARSRSGAAGALFTERVAR